RDVPAHAEKSAPALPPPAQRAHDADHHQHALVTHGARTSPPPRLFPETDRQRHPEDRKSTRLNSSHVAISYAVFCLKKKKHNTPPRCGNTHRNRSARTPL